MSQMTTRRKTLELLKKRYAANLPGKVAKIRECVAAVLGASGNPGSTDEACRALHSLIGSSGTYGFPTVSIAAGRAESMLKESLEAGAVGLPERQAKLRDLMALVETEAFLAAAEYLVRVA